MNYYYAVMESPHRWLWLSGISFLGGMVGAIFMLAFVWPHPLAEAWLLAGIALALYFLVRAGIDWKNGVEKVLPKD